MKVYYNDNDKFVCDWLFYLMKEGAISHGEIDDRSITDIHYSDVRNFDQCHFFAGIGGWAYALDMAKWREPVWTGSCPCQPFSTAGKRRGAADERHLWPEFHRLIAECRPPVVFGEQVASKDGRLWLAGVRADLEALGYAVGAADLCAAGVGAPHIRQRLWWVADAECNGQSIDKRRPRARQEPKSQNSRKIGGLGDTYYNQGPQGRRKLIGEHAHQRIVGAPSVPWDKADRLPCLDGKARRVEPGTFPLVNGVSARVGRLRGYGNAINPYVAAEFIKEFMEARLELDAV